MLLGRMLRNLYTWTVVKNHEYLFKLCNEYETNLQRWKNVLKITFSVIESNKENTTNNI